MMKVLLVLSGGQDSTTCGFMAKHGGNEIHALTIRYGQRHQREIDSAIKIGRLLGVASHEVLDVGPILNGASPLVSANELEQYGDFNSLPGGVEKTFVPMRNQLFLTIAMNRAFCLGARQVITGVCQADYGGYPDCRADFLQALELAATIGTFTGEEGLPRGIKLVAPLMWMTKAQSIWEAHSIPDAYESLAYTHTSYDGAYPPTGFDHATLLRAKGFHEAGLPDPLILRAHLEGLMELPHAPEYDMRRARVGNAASRVQKFLERTK